MNMAKGSYGIYATHIGYLTENQLISTKLFKEMAHFIRLNNIKPVIGKEFRFDQIPDAHQYMESRNSYGKIVIKVI